MRAAPRNDDLQTLNHLVHYETVANDWRRVARSFVRSFHAYQAVVLHRSRREGRTLHTVALDAGVLAPQPAATQIVHGCSVDAPGSDRPKVADASASTALQSGPLTRRQFEIAELIAQGYSNDQIAEKLVLTPGTVGNHIGNILRRLNVRNRAQVAVWVTQQPVLSPSDH